ncbi:MAG: HdeD family acid-resistance protein [Bilifractor sp.]
MKLYDNGDDVINEVRERWNSHVKSVRIWGFIAAVLMIIMGIVCMIFPVQTTYVIEVFASAALLLWGIWEIVSYFQRPVILRTGVSLMSGILNVILGIMLLTSPADELLIFFGFLFGLDLMMVGFEQLTLTGTFHAFGVINTGWMTFDGILNILVGIILLFMPIASVSAVSVLLSFYLLAGGITLLIECINAKELKR